MRFQRLSILAASAVVSLAPLAMAHAQTYGSLGQREAMLDSRIDRAHDDGTIDSHQARRLHDAVRSVRFDEDRLRDDDGGMLSGYDRDNLQSRLDGVDDQLNDLNGGW
jgi:hypothetical protein